ncbi:hypothetical protein ETU08_02535 [Apibacter muscae]|uniref:Uncharacterized protein n=1 Tax=Apibacter muscae TaxID=2509004 RepID=A0A563DIR6_9FLAO|nr:hypothetical protein [Apibacter muscae]TWP24698.1 hypothetical protein ETU10_01695 [Apibacter muscae]TWP29753.1 hypothetical protein ETU09_01885 [Apibacter muscae]TWP30900.1 hypothetical protein ETU08_02535 [Apibacter muscae]
MNLKELKQKMEIGDYILASKMLKITPENVRIRFSREKKDVLEVLKLIIDNREKLIKKFQENEN